MMYYYNNTPSYLSPLAELFESNKESYLKEMDRLFIKHQHKKKQKFAEIEQKHYAGVKKFFK
ncbi:MAG: hypothetical protein ACLFUW_00390 [Bacteroidales bacterium]